MAIEYRVVPTQRRAMVTGRGLSRFADFEDVFRYLVADDRFAASFDVLVDFSRLRYTPSFAEIRRFAGLAKDFRHAFVGRVAIVVADATHLRLGRFASVLAGLIRFELQVFGTVDAAERWIDKGKDDAMEQMKEKVRDLLKPEQLAALATVADDGAPWVRYVAIRGTDDLSVRFATPISSRKVRHIRACSRVHLTCGVGALSASGQWLQIAGRATIDQSSDVLHDFWNDTLGVYFSGPDDPEYAVVVVTPYRIELMDMAQSTPEVLVL